MMFKATVLAALVAATTSQPCPEIPDGGCSVCGEGQCVTAGDEVFAFPGQPAVACSVLQDAGLAGAVGANCPFLPPLIGICACAAPPPPTPAPVTPTDAPVAPVAPTTPPGECPAVPEGACNVCGDLGCVQLDDPIFTFPDQPLATCAQLQAAGFNGTITTNQCQFLPPLIRELCACGTPGTDAPVNPAPVAPPTPAPVVPPTAAPVTAAPVTPAPIATIAPTIKVPTAPTAFPIFILTPQPTPTDELDSDESDEDGGMGMGMGMGGMGMGMGGGDDSSDDGMSMAMKKRRLAGIRTSNTAARRGVN